MDGIDFIDALTGDRITQDASTGTMYVEHNASDEKHESIFFPGCSFINYAMPLAKAVYDTLLQHEVVDGISLLCCGKILSYEPNGDMVRPAFEEQLRDHVAAAGIKRFVCACPNCVKALREAFALDPRTKDVELLVLPQVLADLGYRVDRDTAALLIKGDKDAEVLLCPHDSCPDREYGDFARGLRAILPDNLWVDPEHSWRKSVCCGSLPRAAGKVKAADKCAELCGTESVDVGADAIVTACVSCAFQLTMAQAHIDVVHVLELLYSWRINWGIAGGWMKLRFLFDETLGVIERESGHRKFEGLGEVNAETESDKIAGSGVDISDVDVEEVGL